MDPVRDALIAGVLPGAIAAFALVVAGVALALVHGPLLPTDRNPSPNTAFERVLIAIATLAVGGGVLLSMRWLEPYPGWWPLNIPGRVPALVGIGVIVSSVVAAGPGRWWFAMPVCVLGAGVISHGVRGPLAGDASPWLAVALDALIIGVPAFLVQYLVNRVAAGDRSLLVRPLPLLALALAILPIPALIFVSGQSVSARQFGTLVAVLTASAIALALLGGSRGRLALRGIGVLVVMTIGVWMLIVSTLAIHLLSPVAAVLLIASCVGAGFVGWILPRLKRWWTPVLLTLLLVGGPIVAATVVQYQGIERDEAGGSPADYGY
ncbi:MAG: hypothetical protein KIT54_05770 [Phycisphaeraceae bacterium]|nr:hypothetical protein [Phycisphaeraceae bacterium]